MHSRLTVNIHSNIVYLFNQQVVCDIPVQSGKGGEAIGISKHFVNAHLGLD